MRALNPFMQRRRTSEVTLRTCPDCKGTGIDKESDEEAMCFKCGGSGEIIEKQQQHKLKII